MIPAKAEDKSWVGSGFLIPAVLGCILMSATVFFVGETVPYALLENAGLLFLLLSARNMKGRKEFCLLYFLLWLGHSISHIFLFSKAFPYYLIVPACMVPYTLVLALLMKLDSFLTRRGGWAVVIFPLGYMALSILTVELNASNLLNIAVSWMALPCFRQNIRFLTEYGYTFVWTLVLSLLANAFAPSGAGKRIRRLVLPVLMSALLFAGGAIREIGAVEPDYSLHVAVALSEENDFLGSYPIETSREEQLEKFRSDMEKTALGHAELLVTNEEYYLLSAQNEEWVLQQLSEVVRSYGIPALVSFDELVGENELSENKAVFFDADGTILCTYYKNNLVPFIEAGMYVDGPDKPGVVQCTFGGHEVSMAVIICFDVNDSAFVRTIPESTELLLVPSWDWDNVNLEQKLSFLRSTEVNTTILKHSFEGFTFASGPYGNCSEILDNRGIYSSVRFIDVPIWEK